MKKTKSRKSRDNVPLRRARSKQIEKAHTLKFYNPVILAGDDNSTKDQLTILTIG
jgi:hypothetical protein